MVLKTCIFFPKALPKVVLFTERMGSRRRRLKEHCGFQILQVIHGLSFILPIIFNLQGLRSSHKWLSTRSWTIHTYGVKGGPNKFIIGTGKST
jgi:hypothetical protein